MRNMIQDAIDKGFITIERKAFILRTIPEPEHDAWYWLEWAKAHSN